MILLDTNVISEAMREEPDERVILWLDAQPNGSVGTTAVSVAEILHGIAKLPPGRRRTDLNARFRAFFDHGLGRRATAFDEAAAHTYAGILVDRRRRGKPMTKLDAMIAATALAQGADLATRNTKDFSDCGVALINPWEAPKR